MEHLILQAVENWSYLAVFFILVACGLGLPIPEEVTLIASGYVAWLQKSNWLWMIVVCVAAILIGDLITYYIGRHFGMRVFRSRFFRKLLTEPRLVRVQGWYAKYGAWTVFFSRFVAGLRFCSYFTAGTMRVRIPTFLFMDFLGALVSVPISVWFGHRFAEELTYATRRVRHINQALLLAAVAVILCIVLYKMIQERRARERAAAAASGPPSPRRETAPPAATGVA